MLEEDSPKESRADEWKEFSRLHLLGTVDPDTAAPAPRKSFDDRFREELLKAYPLAEVVEEPDDRFVQLLERIAAINIGGSKRP